MIQEPGKSHNIVHPLSDFEDIDLIDQNWVHFQVTIGRRLIGKKRIIGKTIHTD